VANLSAGKRVPIAIGRGDRLEEFSAWAEKGQRLKDGLLALVDEDTRAFNQIMAAFRLPKGSDEEKAARKQAIQDATRYAIETPLRTMELAFAVFELAEAMVKEGNPNSVSDAGVGALCARAAVYGGWMNVKINTASLADKTLAAEFLKKAEDIAKQTDEMERRIVKLVEGKM